MKCNGISIKENQNWFRFFALWASHKAEANGRHLKLKKPAQLQEVLDISRTLLSEVEAGNADPELEEKRGKLEQLKSVLEMYAYILAKFSWPSYNQLLIDYLLVNRLLLFELFLFYLKYLGMGTFLE